MNNGPFSGRPSTFFFPITSHTTSSTPTPPPSSYYGGGSLGGDNIRESVVGTTWKFPDGHVLATTLSILSQEKSSLLFSKGGKIKYIFRFTMSLLQNVSVPFLVFLFVLFFSSLSGPAQPYGTHR